MNPASGPGKVAVVGRRSLPWEEYRCDDGCGQDRHDGDERRHDPDFVWRVTEKHLRSYEGKRKPESDLQVMELVDDPS